MPNRKPLFALCLLATLSASLALSCGLPTPEQEEQPPQPPANLSLEVVQVKGWAADGVADAFCPNNTKLVGGGCDCHTEVFKGYPIPGADSYLCACTSPSPPNPARADVTAHALCLKGTTDRGSFVVRTQDDPGRLTIRHTAVGLAAQQRQAQRAAE